MQLHKTPGYKIIAAWLRAQGFQPFPSRKKAGSILSMARVDW
jgi:hypothetical protein